jgi:hypothetical protein
MSNTSTVTPYEEQELTSAGTSFDGNVVGGVLDAACTIGATVLVATAVGTISAARWLMDETPEDRAVRARVEEERRHERLAIRSSRERLAPTKPESLRIVSQPLLLRDTDSLVQAAQTLGYRLEPLIRPTKTTAQPSLVLMRGAHGERLAIEKKANGRLTVHTAGSTDRMCLDRIEATVRQNSVNGVITLARAKGMSLKIVTLPNRAVQFVALQTREQGPAGAPMLKGQINPKGDAWVDVSGVQGSACEPIVNEFAQAIGGRVATMTKKDAYYEEPAELTRPRIRV